MSSLKEQALAAHKASRDEGITKRHQEREDTLTNLIDNWESRWAHRLDEAPPCPDRNEFGWDTVTGGHRQGHISGWLFEIDDVEFIYPEREGLHVVLTCPDCGERQGESFYGIVNLGDRLKKQRTLFHKCHQVAARELAYAIRAATDATGLSPHRMFDEAMEIRSTWRT